MTKPTDKKGGSYQNLSIMDEVRKAAHAKTTDDMTVDERLKIILEWDRKSSNRSPLDEFKALSYCSTP